MNEAPDSDNALDQGLARLVILRNMLDPQQLRECHDEQARAIQSGGPTPPLHQLLLKHQLVDADQLIELVLEAQQVELAETMIRLTSSGDESRSEPVRELRSGERIGDYTILRRIAMGGMGVVYQALDQRLSRTVCLKLMLRKDALKRFEQEARTAGKLQHPGIVRLLDVAQEGELNFLVMDLVEGWPLDQVVSTRRPNVDETLNLMEAMLQAVGYMHEQGVVHRDLKPANIIVAPDGRPRLIDFSLAKLTHETPSTSLTQHGTPIGTPGYMPPEQIINLGTIGRSADIYSLGVILYELLTGQLPFDGDTPEAMLEQIRGQDPPAPHVLSPGIDPGLSRVVARAIARKPGARFQTAEAFRMALREGRVPASRLAWLPLIVTLMVVAGGLAWRHLPMPQARVPLGKPAAGPIMQAPRPAAEPQALARALGRQRFERFKTGGPHEDLFSAIRHDPTLGHEIRERLPKWHRLGRHDLVLAGLQALQASGTLQPPEAGQELQYLLGQVAQRDNDLGAQVGHFWRSCYPQQAAKEETRLIQQYRDKPSVPQVQKLMFLVGGGSLMRDWRARLVQIARQRRFRRQYDGALRLLDLVRASSKKMTWQYHYIRGMVYASQHQHARALEEFDRVYPLSTKTATPLHQALILLHERRLRDARLKLSRIRIKSPRMSKIQQIMLAAIELLRNDKLDGRKKLGRLIAGGELRPMEVLQSAYPPGLMLWKLIADWLPDSPEAHAELGAMHADLGHSKSARHHLRWALRLAPADWRQRQAVRTELEKLDFR